MKKIDAGLVRISEDLTISPGYSFEEFKSTKFYKKQDGIKIIYLDEQQMIEKHQYIVSLFFRTGKIYMVSLICCDKDYSESDEYKRKALHDNILKELGIIEKRKFDWGMISSDYDARSNISSINVTYFN
ncbi:MAG: hypothetical protein HDR30_00795 [Lachnospiraceae bacterium]|nr:hypothetical protein [Lachnospiraceae bacterium]